ncbi:hypothetical protein CBM2634_A310022 [Cupriavidus taiwanensis]|uniref:Uncharacterized protein n=1 Tax=Cupriavidus taiwanensis TaxID=164546 RepID=A0A375J3F7_9BURK|nr:hypothetical protein CBM2634_A310022 [Cupriavidus taiwanensis]
MLAVWMWVPVRPCYAMWVWTAAFVNRLLDDPHAGRWPGLARDIASTPSAALRASAQ